MRNKKKTTFGLSSFLSWTRKRRFEDIKKTHQNYGLCFDVVAEFAVWCHWRDNHCAVCKDVGTQNKTAKTLQKEDSGGKRRKAWLSKYSYLYLSK